MHLSCKSIRITDKSCKIKCFGRNANKPKIIYVWVLTLSNKHGEKCFENLKKNPASIYTSQSRGGMFLLLQGFKTPKIVAVDICDKCGSSEPHFCA
jgi:hypothetical protein